MEYYNLAELSPIEFSLHSHDSKCVFISYKSEDIDAAIGVGDYLIHQARVHIYLDTKDCVLKEAISAENDEKIVESIKRGLSKSTHILCIISDKTRLSWWVPYEIGIADNSEINIASLKLRNVDDIPSFLKIHKSITDVDEFVDYTRDLGRYGRLFFNFADKAQAQTDVSALKQYID